MSEKSSFVLYVDNGIHFALLSNEDAGQLIKAIFVYADTGVVADLPEGATMLFSVIKTQIDRDAKKWAAEKEQRREAGRRGGLARASNAKRKQVPLGNTKQTQANQAVTVTVTDTVTVKGQEIIADKPANTHRFTAPTIKEVEAYCRERGNNIDAQRFVDHYTANGWMRGKTKIKDWRACVRTWEKGADNERAGTYQDPPPLPGVIRV